MNQHTLGPWRAEGVVILASCDDTLSEIAVLEARSGSLPDIEQAANARLVAAAPEIYTQLQFCLRLIEDENLDELHGDLAECVRALLAKIEGENT